MPVARKFKYDSNIEEYFVETEDSETLRRSELEQVKQSEILEAWGLGCTHAQISEGVGSCGLLNHA